MVFSYHGEFSRFQVSKYIEYSAYTGCISLYIYCLITCNIKSLLNVPKISHISRNISQVSQFPANSPDSRNNFFFLPKQPLLELSPPVTFMPIIALATLKVVLQQLNGMLIMWKIQQAMQDNTIRTIRIHPAFILITGLTVISVWKNEDLGN